MLLTFLQCLAPLLHAHAGGLHGVGSGHVHLDDLTVAPLQAHTVFRVDLSDTPSVSAPAEYRRDSVVPGGESFGTLAFAPHPVPEVNAARVAEALPLFLFSLPRLSPPAQAPPAAG
ncbi:MAG: hypothetical protein KGZ83_20475 [Sulfuricella sp.]|nr:hypothetical protein [Sulfuricella sp.]